MKFKRESDNRIFSEAAQWISDFQDDRADRPAFFAWLAESPRHVEELTLALALTHEIQGLSDIQRSEIEALASQATGSTASSETMLPPNVVSLHDSDLAAHARAPANSLSTSHWIRRAVTLAAGIAAISLAGWWAFEGPLSWRTYTTKVGEQRALELEDGSVVNLNTDSQLKVRFSRSVRVLRLVAGEALFKVRHETERPFLVDAGDSMIRAIGTQFNVYRRVNGTIVSVLEGTVRIPRDSPLTPTAPSNTASASVTNAASAQASAGETVDVSQGRLIKHRQVNTADVVAWRQRRLVFHDDTLLEIAAEFNRYNRTPQLEVEGAQAQQHRFAGTFDADAPEALLATLRSDESLVIERGLDRIVIRSEK
jgi:transmembrane sensor